MYYLQKVNVILEHMEYKMFFLPLRDELHSHGVRMELCGLGTAEAQKMTENLEINEDQRSGLLWMTDNSALARCLAERQCPVLAFLHEDNDELDFGEVRYACEKPEEVESVYLEGVYRRCMRLPLDILATERLFLRETTEADVDMFYRIYDDPSITQYMEGLYPDRQEERAYIREYIEKIYNFYDFGVWTVGKRDTGEVIGRAGFAYREGFEEPELGFVIGVPWQRQGYAYEICSAILKYGWEQLEFTKVRALVQPDNEPSLQLCRKLGMECQGKVIDKGIEYNCMMLHRGEHGSSAL